MKKTLEIGTGEAIAETFTSFIDKGTNIVQ